jgi:hypothetical protein
MMLITREQARHLVEVAPTLNVVPALRPHELEIDLGKTILALHEVIDQLTLERDAALDAAAESFVGRVHDVQRQIDGGG